MISQFFIRTLGVGLGIAGLLTANVPAQAFQGPVGSTADSTPAPAVPGGRIPPLPVPGRAPVVVPDVDSVVHEGVVATVADGIVTINIEGADPLSVPVAETVRILLDGRPVRLADLRRGDRVLVTMAPEGRAALAITAGRTAPPVRTPRRVVDDPAAPARVVARKPVAGENAETRRAPLGVVASAAPTTGVLIQDVDPRSPLARAGLRPGDYVLRVGEEEIRSPRQMREALMDPAGDDGPTLVVWRDGESRSIKPDLRTPEVENRDDLLKEQPAGRAWLGFQLAPRDDNGKGVLITDVLEGGPAARAGLRSGDVLLTVAGKEVATPDAVSERIETVGPNQRADVEIERNGVVSKIDVRVGEAEATEDAAAGPISDPASFDPAGAQGEFGPDPLFEQNQRLERLLTELLAEVREMREQMGQTTSGRGANVPRAPSERPEVPAADAPAGKAPNAEPRELPAPPPADNAPQTPPEVPGRPRA